MEDYDLNENSWNPFNFVLTDYSAFKISERKLKIKYINLLKSQLSCNFKSQNLDFYLEL